jgi:hypothetical protein
MHFLEAKFFPVPKSGHDAAAFGSEIDGEIRTQRNEANY